jgi:poly-gamma-glutamate synthesis protein (capsule biosynthesis protein)
MSATLFVCGDVMPGRGIDQILPQPSDPLLHEPYVTSAEDYLRLAERSSGAIPRRVQPAYIWGDALAEFERARPAARLINLETAVTRSHQYWPKGINYRMHPANVGCLTAAGIHCCVLANNHVLDWGHAGLLETVQVLHGAGLKTAGAGATLAEAALPAAIDLGDGGRVLVFAFALPDSGVPLEWAAQASRAGVRLLEDLSASSADEVARQVHASRREGDIVIVSLHWGGNWGYALSQQQVGFAHRLVDMEGVDLVHGHSSHHPKGIEVHHGKLILYGCGDLINDYEGIAGREEYRGELGLLYFVTLEAGSGRLERLELVPMRRRRFRLERASRADAQWLHAALRQAGEIFGTRLTLERDGRMGLDGQR